MALLIIAQPGQVIAVADPTDTPMPIAIQGWGDAGSMKAIVTEVSVSRASGVQYAHTLKDLVYVYSFGERIGQMRIAGIAFAALCGTDATTGLDSILNYYEAFRVGRAGAPVTVAIGTTAAGRFRGFLNAMRADVVRPEARLAQYALEFTTLPTSIPAKGTSSS